MKMVKGLESKHEFSGNEEPVTDEDADIVESEEDIPAEPEEDLKEE
jgi:hypothetical protein